MPIPLIINPKKKTTTSTSRVRGGGCGRSKAKGIASATGIQTLIGNAVSSLVPTNRSVGFTLSLNKATTGFTSVFNSRHNKVFIYDATGTTLVAQAKATVTANVLSGAVIGWTLTALALDIPSTNATYSAVWQFEAANPLRGFFESTETITVSGGGGTVI
jgi:hypothetical protein